jgi:hypothetical protein
MDKNKKYIVTVTLTDDSIIELSSDYNWGYDDKLNDTRYEFIDIKGNSFNKKYIKHIIFSDNPNYKEIEKEKEEE